MLRIHACQSEAAAKQYFTCSLDRGDYYMSDHELPGYWGGRGAERLGLSGVVAQKEFFLLSETRHPATGERLTARTKENRRIGYDLTFNCSKGLSIEHAFNDYRKLVLDAFKAATNSTMAHVEKHVKSRVRVKGQNHDRITGNLVWAAFIHFTSRPVDGVPDPHLHVHVFAFNCTFDNEEHRWKAAQIGDIKKDAPYFESLFHAHLHFLRKFGRRPEFSKSDLNKKRLLRHAAVTTSAACQRSQGWPGRIVVEIVRISGAAVHFI